MLSFECHRREWNTRTYTVDLHRHHPTITPIICDSDREKSGHVPMVDLKVQDMTTGKFAASVGPFDTISVRLAKPTDVDSFLEAVPRSETMAEWEKTFPRPRPPLVHVDGCEYGENHLTCPACIEASREAR